MLLALFACDGEPTPPCVVFAGDLSLARGIGEALGRGPSPWDAFPAGDSWIGNLEGALSTGHCAKAEAYCLGFEPPALASLARGPWAALSLANNHALDFGDAGRAATVHALRGLGVAPLLEAQRPTLVSVAGMDLALVPIDFAGTDAQVALEQARLTLLLARAHTPWVVALPHWGIEGVDDLGPGQERTAEILHTWGATLVIGTGAHVVQPSTCTEAGATWYGLGNHLFDQVPPASHEGALVRCCPVDGTLRCSETRTRRSPPSPLPVPAPGVVSTCDVAATPIDPAWKRHPWVDHFRSVQPFPGGDLWLGLHDRISDIDDEVGLRPYVFRMTPTGYEEVWRGSSLARPLVAARLFTYEGEAYLCALHRADAFLHPDPTTRDRIYTLYRWNGFGFRGVDHPAALATCAR